MTIFDSSFRRSCEFLNDTARRQWGHRFLGRRVNWRSAGGADFIGHSDYTSGDDIRYVDWQICARHDELVTRQFRGSEDRYVYFLLDCSAGMRLGEPSKFDTARRLAAALGYMAVAIGDGVTVAAISNRLLFESPAVRGKHQLHRLYRFLDEQTIDDSQVNLQAAVDGFIHDRPRRGVAVVLSDLFDPAGFEQAVDRLAKRGFEPFLLQVVSDFDAAPDLTGGVKLLEAGGRRVRRADLDAIDLKNYASVYRDFNTACRRYCARRSFGIVQTRSSTPYQQAVLRIIHATTSRMYGHA